jgi:hypothetical protein
MLSLSSASFRHHDLLGVLVYSVTVTLRNGASLVIKPNPVEDSTRKASRNFPATVQLCTSQARPCIHLHLTGQLSMIVFLALWVLEAH